jgi:O-antigen ligase
MALGVLSALHPRKALACAWFMVMLAETKFRMRDPGALLAGDVDSQILFELLLYGIILLVVVLNFLSSAYQPLTPMLTEWVLCSYILLALLSSFWAADARITVARGVQLCILYALCFVSLRVLGPQNMLRLLTASTVSYVLLFALLAVLFPWADGTRFTQTTHIPRFTWFSLHPITTAAYAGTATLLLAAEGLFAPGTWRRRLVGLPLWLLLIPLVLVLLATRSRGAILAFLVALTALGCRRYVNPWVAGGIGYGLLALSAMSLGLDFSIPASLQKALSTEIPLVTFLLRGQAIEEFLSLSGRTELWQYVHALFLKHPLLGYGYLASRSMLLTVFPWAGEAHNALAESLLDVGVIGTALVWCALLSAFLSSLLATLRLSSVGGWQHACIFGALLFLLLHSLVDATFAGTPGYQALLLFATTLAHSGLTREIKSGVGTLETVAWRSPGTPARVREALLAWVCLKRAVSLAQKTS